VTQQVPTQDAAEIEQLEQLPPAVEAADTVAEIPEATPAIEDTSPVAADIPRPSTPEIRVGDEVVLPASPVRFFVCNLDRSLRNLLFSRHQPSPKGRSRRGPHPTQ
jgi:hypothetical protein